MVGVSGGADSMALAWMLARWGAPLACIVDHGLRPGSADEARQAATRLGAIGVPARVLPARLRPGPRLSERARQARYDLLLASCREAGCADLLVAHHARDQAETVRMRRDAGSGGAGLAGMAAVVHLETARLLRPLLSVSPERLRATAKAAGLEWAEDPTNQDCHFLRPRLRQSMTVEDTGDAIETALRHGAERRTAERAVAAELADAALYPEGYAYLPAPLRPAAFAALVWTLSGRPYPPRTVGVEWRERTLHGVELTRAGRLGPGWLLMREPASVAAPVPARAGAHWDGRFLLTEDVGPGVAIGALGADAARFRRVSSLPAAILRALPALRRGEEVIAVPHLAFPDRSACRSVILLCTARPAAGAPFVPARLAPGDADGAVSTHVVGTDHAARSGVGNETGSLGIR